LVEARRRVFCLVVAAFGVVAAHHPVSYLVVGLLLASFRAVVHLPVLAAACRLQASFHQVVVAFFHQDSYRALVMGHHFFFPARDDLFQLRVWTLLEVPFVAAPAE
jgi:hypothetical protein